MKTLFGILTVLVLLAGISVGECTKTGSTCSYPYSAYEIGGPPPASAHPAVGAQIVELTQCEKDSLKKAEAALNDAKTNILYAHGDSPVSWILSGYETTCSYSYSTYEIVDGEYVVIMPHVVSTCGFGSNLVHMESR